MSETWAPQSVTEVPDAVGSALTQGHTLELVGTGSRRVLGRPAAADRVLDLSALSGIVSYEPEELILIVAPATTMEEIEVLLFKSGQHLAFEPPDLGRLWGSGEGNGTIGGAVLTGLSGPRRMTAGAVRDHLLGMRGVNGFGQPFVAGGRVVKNVTGFDIAKLVAGSFGTLCVVTELTLKVLPRPREIMTLALFGLTDTGAIDTIRRALNETTADVSSAAHIPADVAASSQCPDISGRGTGVTLLRVEGQGPAVAARLDLLRNALRDTGPSEVLDKAASVSVWAEVTGCAYFAGNDRSVWRMSVPPSVGGGVGERLRTELGARCYYDLAGGAVWAEIPVAPDAACAAVRDIVAHETAGDGLANLYRADATARAGVSPFQPFAAKVEALVRRVQRQFDPHGIFNPGRLRQPTP